MTKKNKKLIIIAAVALLVLIGIFSAPSSEDENESTASPAFSETEGTTENSLFSEDSGSEKESEKTTDEDEEARPSSTKANNTTKKNKTTSNVSQVTPSSIPTYKGSPYITVNNNEPTFTSSQKNSKKSFETYANLDYLGRCGTALALIGKDIMPTGERGEIGQIKPTGWQTAKYDFVDGKYLYNRCHLIGWQLTGENANSKNLITGTRYMNVEGMLPFENMVDDYIEETNNHVLYRVTPIFKGKELVARGVQIEAYSVEDEGDGICFNVYCFNVQSGVEIDYQTGASARSGEEITTKAKTTVKATTTKKPTTTAKPTTSKGSAVKAEYVVNTNPKSMKFHLPSCPSADDISAENRWETNATRESLISKGYTPCGRCKP